MHIGDGRTGGATKGHTIVRAVIVDREPLLSAEGTPDVALVRRRSRLFAEAIGSGIRMQIGREQATDGTLAAMAADGDGSFAQTYARGNFGLWQRIDVGMDQNGTCLGRKECQRVTEHGHQACSFDRDLDIPVVGVRHCTIYPLRGSVRCSHLTLPRSHVLPLPAPTYVACNARQPRVLRRRVAQRSVMPPRLKQRFLRQIFCNVRVARDGCTQAHQARPLRSKQRFPIASLTNS